jgi:DNA-binding NarL/FixJ family response regulator
MIRILIVDDHPAMRAGLNGVLTAEPGIVPLGSASSADELLPALNRTKPDLVLLDYHLPDADGLVVCREIKRQMPAPKVLIYSAYADAELAIPAILAGADGLLHKSAPASELYNAIRTVARGERVMPPVTGDLVRAFSERLDEADLPVLGLALDGSAPAEIAATLRLDAADVAGQVDRMLERSRVTIAAPAE